MADGRRAGPADPGGRRRPRQLHTGTNVLFRKPIERRAKDTVELTELLHELLVAQVATYLGVEPS